MLMVLGGLLSVLGSRAIGFTSAGALGVMVLSCVCGRNWHQPKHIKNVINAHIHTFIYISLILSVVNGERKKTGLKKSLILPRNSYF